MNIVELDNLYPSPKEIISNQETLLSTNSFKLIKGDNNNNNTANNNNIVINKKRIDANLSEVYILPEDSKWERRAWKRTFFTTQYNNNKGLDTYYRAFSTGFK